MKNWYILSVIICSFSFAKAQHISYDTQSKWFFGINAGATWSSTDVKKVNSGGYGFTFGRSYNYDYGKRISFDLRGRFLTGTWVGQDTNAFSLVNYSGGPLSAYQLDSSSVYVNNFQTDVKRLSLELVLHLNNLHERTGFDPYIFGGIGVTWSQTYGDLLQGDSASIYDYSSLQQNGPIGPQLSTTLDGIYETRLDGGSNHSYQAKWMPSLGFGLGYQIGKRASIGIEHKTTFTRADYFDGYISTSPRTKNDWYHYTSAYIKVHFKSRGNGHTSSNNASNINNYSTTTNCPKPVVTLLSGNNKTVTNSQYRLEFKVSNLNNASGITLYNDQNQPVLFNYNAANQLVDANVQLHIGQNTFRLTANNNCGNETADVLVTLLNCVTPTAVFTNPTGGAITVKSSDFAFSAMIQGSVQANNIKLLMNGMALNGATFNPSNGLLQKALVLNPGVNTIQLTVSNDCGTNTYTATIQYDNCVPVQVQFLNPSASGTTINSASFNLSASVSGSFTNAVVKLSQNGVILPNVVIQTNGQIQLPLTLIPGLNTFNLTVSNGCGNDVEMTIINFQNCSAPTITIQSPTQNQSITSSTAIRLKSVVTNITNKQNINVLVNGIEQSSFTFNSTTGALELGLTPISGNNSITITATNNCGSDVETIQFNSINCTGITPNVTILSAGGSTNNGIYNLFASTTSTATITQNGQTISVMQNGVAIPFNQLSNQINAVTTLIPGVNTFVVSATTSACGSDSKTITVNYNNCIAPQISLLQPSTTGGTTNVSLLNFQAAVSNISQSQNVQLVKNGQQIPFTFANGQVQANINLSNGINTITLSVNNACGNDAETFTVNFVQCTPPVLQLTSTVVNGSTVTNSLYSLNASVTGVNSAQNIQLKLNGTTIPFTYTNGTISSSVSLTPGQNTLVLSASNDCGLDAETFTLIYDNCIAPSISNFSNNPQTVLSNSTQTFTATIAHANTQQIVFTQNGIQRPFTFVNGQFNALINLVSGNNSLVLSVANNCGSDQHHWDVTFTPCTAPSITITNPSNSGISVNTANYSFQASIQNISSTQGILFTLNGTAITNLSYNNGNLSANINLQNGLNTLVLKATNACGTDIKTITIFYNNCVAPVITVTNPSINASSVSTASYTYSANIQHITSGQGILLSLNGNAITNFTYSNGTVSANVSLSSGMNTFVLTVSNACGSDMKTSTVTYLNCTPPSVQIINPSNGTTTVNNATYLFQGAVQQLTSAQGVNLTLNGTVVNNFTYSNGQISATVNLTSGLNTFVLSATNACGSDSKTQVLTYNPCSAPQVNISDPANTNYGVSNPLIHIQGTISNMSNSQGISLSLNGNSISNFSYNNGQFSADITLSNGMNTIVLTATNACGNDAQSRVIRYEPCNAPIFTITNPTGTNYIANTNSVAFTASVQNMTNAQGLSVTLNGVPLNNVQFNSTTGLVSVNLPLSNGNNSVTISANGSCGTDSKTINISYNPCIAPQVQITNPSNNALTVSSSTFVFEASVQQVTAQQINLSLNGQAITNFNLQNGQLTATLNLTNGNNEINLSVTNTCGSDSKFAYIKYEACLTPVVNITNPSSTNTSVTNANYSFSGSIQNMGSGQGISLTLNGNIIPNASFMNGQISAMLNLANGLNQLVLSAQNACGSANETTTIILDQCVPPVVTIINPVDLFYGVNSPIFPFQANIQNMSNTQGINLTVAGVPVNNFNFSNGSFTATLNLPEGVDEIVLTATNACGTASQLRTIRYQSCIPPVITITTDPASGSTVNTNNLSFTSSVTNYAPSTSIQLLLNGMEISTFGNSNGNISATLNLAVGMNTIQITATSSCGIDTKSYVITYDDGSQNGGGSGSGNSDGMIQQNQQPSQYKTNNNQTNQNRPVQQKPVQTQPAPVQTTPTNRPAQTSPQARPVQPARPTTTPTPSQAKPTVTPTPTTTKPAGGGVNNPSPVQQSSPNPPNPIAPKGGTPQKGGGK